MAFSHLHSLLVLCCLLLFASAHAFRPSGLVLPVSKDASTLQYTTTLSQRTPLVPIKVILDLGGKFLWVDCDKNYVSSTYSPARCHSAQCSLANSQACGSCNSAPRPGCSNNTCGVFPENTVTNIATSGDLGSDVVSVDSTDGSSQGQAITVSKFLFSCAPAFLTKGLASGSAGMAGLGRANIGLPTQFSSKFSFAKQFAICLSGSTRGYNGVAFFGPGPYTFLPNIVVSSSNLFYTPLLINPVSTAGVSTQGERSTEYFVGVKSITISDTVVALNNTLLKIDSKGFGGTKISTVEPFTVMEDSIFKAFTSTFVKEAAARNISRVKAVAPFEVCFAAKNIPATPLGAGVPYIDLVMEGGSVSWTLTGLNSMVEVSDDVLCLGFVNGGVGTRTAIVIGGFQLEDNIVEFDLARGRVGFSDTLIGRRTTCANFNFTSTA